MLPEIYGSCEASSFPLYPKGEFFVEESSAAAYAGVVAALLVAPLAFCSRRHRSAAWSFGLLALFGLSWCLNMPGLVQLLRLPGLNMMSHNRLVFLTAFSVLSLAAVGLETLRRQPMAWRPWFALPPLFLLGLGLWTADRAVALPEPLATQLEHALAAGQPSRLAPDLPGIHRVQHGFARRNITAACWCFIGAAGWSLLAFRRSARPASIWPVVGLAMLCELVAFGREHVIQCDPGLYYPPIPALTFVEHSPPGRVIGYGCLPSAIPSMCGLNDVRGYDSVDPGRMTELLLLAANSQTQAYGYALTQCLIPRAVFDKTGTLHLWPLLDMLGVRYVIFRDAPVPQAHPIFQGDDYWVMANPAALDRVFVPRSVACVGDPRQRLRLLGQPTFNPRQLALVEQPVDLPAECAGRAAIVEETPCQIKVALDMATPGLVVLGDSWDKGWKAFLNGQPVPVLRANHALRAVLAPAGKGLLEYVYEPASFLWGTTLAEIGAVILLAGNLWETVRARKAAARVHPGPGACEPSRRG